MPTPDELERLSDDVERLLTVVSVEEIADAWWMRALRVQRGERIADYDADWWAEWVWINPSTYDHEDFVRAGLKALAERAPEGADLGYLGAGPLENFVADDDDRLRWTEEEARRSKNFRTALGNVWIDDLPPETFERVQRAAGVPLRRSRA